MTVYWEMVVLLDFLVDYLLLMGTNRLRQSPLGVGRCAIAAAVGGLYAGMCLLPGFGFLGNVLWRTVSLVGMCVIAYGVRREAVTKGAVFVFLTMALGGIATAVGRGGIWSLVLGSAGLCLLCFLGGRGGSLSQKRIPVVIQKGDVVKHLIALHDTGNTLKDPVTGQAVLVLDGALAWDFAGLSIAQLMTPVETMAQARVQGLRLIPFRSVGCSCGMLLAMRMDQVMINGVKSSNLVAFAPQTIGSNGTYQALSGGIV